MQPSLSQYKEWYQNHYEKIKNEFISFLSFPSISTDPAYKDETRKTALWLSDYLQKLGLNVEIWETSGHPVIYASCLKAGSERPTLLIYHHYDVQPVDPLELWHSEPFKPVIKNNQIYARGAVDNKGQCFYSINAVGAFLKLATQVGMNIKIFIEGEEESGGAGTFAILPKKKEALKADYLLIVDSDIPKPGVPGITLGVRGIITMHLECQNSDIDLHSGMLGGIAVNPNNAFIRALAKLWDATGKIAVPGFYDAVRSFSKEKLSSLDTDFDKEEYCRMFGIKAFKEEDGFSFLESNWVRPTLEINGINGGYSGIGFKTVIPSKTIAKISCRLVPDQDPQVIGKAVVQWIRSHLPKELIFTADVNHGAKAYRSPFPSKIATIVQESLEEVFKKSSRRLLCGGSIPIVGELARISGAEALMMGTGLSSDAIHAPNEHFGLDRFEQGFLTMGRILSRINSLGL